MADEYEVYLMHYGVKGMRWGVRRAAGSVPRPSAEQRTAFVKAGKKVATITAKAAAIPVATTALGAGVLAAGSSMKALQDPAVKDAISYAKEHSKLMMNEIGVRPMSSLERYKSSGIIKKIDIKTAIRNKKKELRLERENPGANVTVTGGPFVGNTVISKNTYGITEVNTNG